MNDISLFFGGDLSTSATLDILVASGSQATQQRILRRLLTNPGDYIFHPEYGAGIGAMVGETADIARIRGAIRGQMLMEAGVSHNPEPTVTVSPIDGGVFCDIRYVDADTGVQSILTFNLTN